MFTGLQNTIIRGGTFVVHTNPSPINIQSEGFKILHTNIAIGAFHDSGERFDPPKCHPNTRVAVLAEIMQWIQVVKESEDVLWLYGSAGAGKSAIAQTIAEMCVKSGLLVASFFFSRSSQSRNNEKRLIASIAYQLALSIPATRSYIESAVQIDPSIFDRSLDTQIETLIIWPLKNACGVVNPTDAKLWPKLIIVDGLDECHGPPIQCSIIRLLSMALLRIPVPLILLVASRPEPHIRNALKRSHASRHIVLDDSYEADADIKKFLLSRFQEIKENHQLAAHIPESWPSAGIINRLVQKSSGQFIYASTVMNYLDSPRHRPMKRLDVIIGLIPVDGDMPYKELDALYSHIFSSVEDLAATLKILGFLFFRGEFERATPDFLAHLLCLDQEDVYLCLSELHSILFIPPPPKSSALEIRVTHASLQDFLVDQRRSGKYYLDEETFHTDIAQRCLRQITMLSMNAVGPNLRGLERFSRLEIYLISNFIYHCTRASTDSAALKTDLMEVRDNLRPLFEIVPRLGLYWDLPSLFTWLYKADTTAKELSSHIELLWDQYFISELDKHTFNGSNVDIAGLLFFPSTWNSRWFSLISGTSQVPDIFDWYWVPDGDRGYQHLLSQFFEDRNRSGKYHLDGTVYAQTALECFRNMISPNPNDDEVFNPYPFVLGIGRPDAKLFTSIPEDVSSQRKILVPNYAIGLQAVTKLLSKSAPLKDLYLCLQDHPLQNPAKAKVHCEHGFASLRLAVKVYLDKCKELQASGLKVLRRSPSCPLHFPCVDLELKFGNHSRTFKERWPLASDNLTRSGDWTSRKEVSLRQMRALLEMVALRSRTKVVHSIGEGV